VKSRAKSLIMLVPFCNVTTTTMLVTRTPDAVFGTPPAVSMQLELSSRESKVTVNGPDTFVPDALGKMLPANNAFESTTSFTAQPHHGGTPRIIPTTSIIPVIPLARFILSSFSSSGWSLLIQQNVSRIQSRVPVVEIRTTGKAACRPTRGDGNKLIHDT